MSAFGKCEGGGRRSTARAEAPLMAVFTTRTRTHTAVLADMSSTGARLRGADLPIMGEDLLLGIDTVRAFGIVAWSENGECGIAFDAPLQADEEKALRQKVSAARGLPPDIKAAFDNWVVGCGR